jgi:hypothetical protein
VRVLDRRDFLKKAGLTPLALASLPGLGGVAWADDDDDEEGHGYVFQALSVGNTTADGVVHAVIMGGCGRVDEDHVTGGGAFTHFNNAPTAPTPKPILFTGTWEARRLLSFSTIGSFGRLVAGILEARIRLFPEGAGRLKATLKVVCNIGPGGLSTGQDEGFFLTVNGSPPFGVFKPLVPPLGLTIFTQPEEDDDDDD